MDCPQEKIVRVFAVVGRLTEATLLGLVAVLHVRSCGCRAVSARPSLLNRLPVVTFIRGFSDIIHVCKAFVATY